jgi:hypothetical protein
MKNEENNLVGTSRRDVRAGGSASRPYQLLSRSEETFVRY